jgi:hypothetical protein
MGREIRRVPPGWQHPMQPCRHEPWSGGCREARKNGGQCYRPLYDRDFETEVKEWKENFAKWERGERPAYFDPATDGHYEFWEWDGGPPDRESYRPKWSAEEATHYQMYETVSEGTPVSPVFETLEQLENWMVNEARYSREAAAAFCKGGWAPSMAYVPGKGLFKNADALVETHSPNDADA